jgi:hypothetical protein
MTDVLQVEDIIVLCDAGGGTVVSLIMGQKLHTGADIIAGPHQLRC